MHNHKQAGFSFIEILLGLILVSLIFVSFRYFTVSPKDHLRFTVEKLEKIVQFANQEAIMRGSIVRLRFSFDKLPQEWNLEYGPDGDFILPSLEKYANNEDKLSLMDQERRDKIIQETDNKFQPIPDFPQGHEQIPAEVIVLGLATSTRKDLINFGNSALYFYPTGEKDAALILLAVTVKSQLQIAQIQIQAYLPTVNIQYFPIELSPDMVETNSQEVEQILLQKSKELHQQWLKG